MSSPSHSKRVVLAERPTGPILPSTFKVQEAPISPLGAGQALVRVDYVSIDPAMRGWIRDARSYLPPVQIGETMRAGGLGTVVQVSKDASVRVGDVVSGMLGWTDYLVVDTKASSPALQVRTSAGNTTEEYLDVLAGSVALTAYIGLLEVARVQPGDTVVISGAAGAVGSVAVQLARISGAGKVIGIAGGSSKCEYVEKELGADKCLDYKSESYKEDFTKAVGFLDVYFDNVGGEILDHALLHLKKNARIALCGGISGYNAKPSPIFNTGELIKQRAAMQGFIVLDYPTEKAAKANKEMLAWKKQGKLKTTKFHIEEGLERCPEHLKAMFEGVNVGKMVVKFSSKDPGAV